MERFKWGKKELIDTAPLELSLSSALQPVVPRQEFVRRLRSRIMAGFQPDLIEAQNERKMTIMLFAASLAGVFLATLMGVRMMVTLVGTIGLLAQMKKTPKPESIPAARRVS